MSTRLTQVLIIFLMLNVATLGLLFFNEQNKANHYEDLITDEYYDSSSHYEDYGIANILWKYTFNVGNVEKFELAWDVGNMSDQVTFYFDVTVNGIEKTSGNISRGSFMQVNELSIEYTIVVDIYIFNQKWMENGYYTIDMFVWH